MYDFRESVGINATIISKHIISVQVRMIPDHPTHPPGVTSTASQQLSINRKPGATIQLSQGSRMETVNHPLPHHGYEFPREHDRAFYLGKSNFRVFL